MSNNQLSVKNQVNDDVRNIAYAYNLCVVLSKQIIDYDDKYFLHQVYNEILNNINLENFPKDTALCDALASLLSTLGCIDVVLDGEKHIKEKYHRQKKNAIWSALPNPSIILCGGGPASIALNALLGVGTAFMNYKKELNSILEDKYDSEFRLEKQRKEALQANQLRLFRSAWKLSADHPIPDELRLSENDVDRYNEVLKDTDARRRYERLDDMKMRFEAYPPFWFELGEAAREVYIEFKEPLFRSKAIEAFEKFHRIHFVFLRQDVFAASCAISHISLLDKNLEFDKVKALLDKALKFSRDNYDLQQQCVPIALSIGDIDVARRLLKRLTNEGHSLEINGKLLSLIYNRYDYDKTNYDILMRRIGAENVVGWVEIKPQFRLENFSLELHNEHIDYHCFGGENHESTD